MKFIKRKNIDTYRPKSQRFTVEVDGRAIIDTNKSLTVPIGSTADRPATGIPGMIRYNTDDEDFEVFTGYGTWGWERLRTNRPSEITVNNIGTGLGDGTVSSVQVTVGGSGYATAPTITFSPPDVGTDVATGTVNVNGGQIESITMTNDGSGYITVPTVTIDGANQTATLTAILTGTQNYALPAIPVDDLGVLSATNVQIYVENVFQIPGVNYTLVEVGSVASVKFDAPVPFGKPIYAIFGFD
jgi:hypothetical protein